MEKVRQVGESYELTKLKTQNRTIELDARLSSERLLATKMRLSQISNENERLNKQLRSCQQQLREHEKKLLLAETMLRQFVGHDTRQHTGTSQNSTVATLATPPPQELALGTQRSIKRQQHSGLAAKSRMFRQGRLVKFGDGGGGLASIKAAAPPSPSSITSTKATALSTNKATSRSSATQVESTAAVSTTLALLGRQQQQLSDTGEDRPPGQADGGGTKVSSSASGGMAATVARLASASKAAKGGGNDGRVAALSLPRSTTSPNLASLGRAGGATGVGATATAVATTQTHQPSRARTIINDLRQRLNLGHSRATTTASSAPSAASAASLATEVNNRRASGNGGPTVEKIDAAIQAGLQEIQELGTGRKNHDSDDDNYGQEDNRAGGDHYEDEALLYVGQGQSDCDDILGGGSEQSRQRRLESSRRQRSISLDAFLNSSIVRELGGERLIISRGWPPTMMHRHKRQQRQKHRQPAEYPSRRDRTKHNHEHQLAHRRRQSRSHRSHRSGEPLGAPSSQFLTFLRQRRPSLLVRSPATNGPIDSATQQRPISETQKRRLLIEFLEHSGAKEAEPLADSGANGGASSSPQLLARSKATSSGRAGVHETSS